MLGNPHINNQTSLVLPTSLAAEKWQQDPDEQNFEESSARCCSIMKEMASRMTNVKGDSFAPCSVSVEVTSRLLVTYLFRRWSSCMLLRSQK